ncbi:hypothetical protein ACIQC9_06940 [Brevundimonas sp. NPDC092305]|uniref:hypothetical protein n=1 Tax=Brevundimonas sp. NPDC092305 TaxID=3363957 RepID=UPI00381457B8
MTPVPAALALVIAVFQAAGPSPMGEDLIGRRAAHGEADLIRRGFINVDGETAEAAVRTWWSRDEPAACLVVDTRDGRYAAVSAAPVQACIERRKEVGRHEGAPDVRTIRFAPGAASGRETGVLGPSDRARYRIAVRRGQTITIDLSCDAACGFELSAPDSSDVMHRGPAPAGGLRTVAPLTGPYALDVYRRDASGDAPMGFTLQIAVEP